MQSVRSRADRSKESSSQSGYSIGVEQKAVRRVDHIVESVLEAEQIGVRRVAHIVFGAEQMEVRRIAHIV